MWQVKVLTLFPELYPGPLEVSVVGKALENRLWSLEAYNIRDYAYFLSIVFLSLALGTLFCPRGMLRRILF